jgi:hypothetical protein
MKHFNISTSKILLLILLLFTCAADLSAHNPTDTVLLERYWNYRQRFLNRFVRIGDQPGYSMPIEQYMYTDCRNDWIWTNYPEPYVGNGFGILSPGGDQTCGLGHYIAMLATEYALLAQNHQRTDSVTRELYYALKSYFRLEREANEIFHKPSYFGFFLRQDAPNDLHLSFQDDSVPAGKKPFCTISEEIERQFSPDSLWQNFTSQDQVIHLIYGMALAKKCVPSGVMYNGEDVQGLAIEATRRMILRFYTDHWDLQNPNGGQVGNIRGGQAQAWAYGFDKTWAYINPQGTTFGDYVYNLGDVLLKNIYECCAHLGGLSHFYNKRLYISLATTSNTRTLAYNFDYTMTDGLWIYPLTQGILFNSALDSARENRLLDTMYTALTQAPPDGTCININNGNPDCHSTPGWKGQDRWMGNIATRDTITDTNNHPADHYGMDYLLAYNLYRLYAHPDGYHNTHQSLLTNTSHYSNKKMDLSLYPNPAMDQLNVSFYLPEGKIMSFEILDIMGRKMNTFSRTVSETGMQKEMFDISALSTGTYLLSANIPGEIHNLIFVKY